MSDFAWDRFQAGWGIEERADHKWVNELTLEFEAFAFPNKFLKSGEPANEWLDSEKPSERERFSYLNTFSGGYLYAWRPETSEQVLGYVFRFDAFHWEEVLTVRYGFWINGEARHGSWDMGALRNELVVEVLKFPGEATLNLGYVATRDLNRGEWRHQGAIFMNVPVHDWLFRANGK